jgi:hypothetical protein
MDNERIAARAACGLTFELSGRRRQDARPGLAKMYRVPPDRAWWPAVGAPLERGVRPHAVRRFFNVLPTTAAFSVPPNVEVTGPERRGAWAARRNMDNERFAAQVPCRGGSG